MLGPILGTRESAVTKNMKTFIGSVFFLAALSYAQPRYHPEHVHLPEPHTEQAVAMLCLSMQGSESRVDLLPTPAPYPDDYHPCTHTALSGPASLLLSSLRAELYPQARSSGSGLSWKRAHIHSYFLESSRVCGPVSYLV